MDEEVFSAMVPFLKNYYGNPSAMYELARESKEAMEKARDSAAALIGASSREIYFTSGGSESDNMALRGIFETGGMPGKSENGNGTERFSGHLITTSVEHPAVYETCKYLEEKGARVTYLPVDRQGFVTADQVKEAICEDTVLVSVMFANNEVGTIEPVAEIAKCCHDHNVLFHTDAVQAFGQIPIDVEELGIDLLSASAHKLYGPKGCGLLYVRKDIPIRPLIFGGEQEKYRRAGTENVAAIVGFGKACELAKENMSKRIEKEQGLRNLLWDRIQKEIPDVFLDGPEIGHSEHNPIRLPGNLHFRLKGVEGESALILLDNAGICASSGSACATGSIDPSRVLLAMGCTEDEARTGLRFTLSKDTAEEEIEEAVERLSKIAVRLRSMSPDYA